MKWLGLVQLILIIPSLSFSEVIQEGNYSLKPHHYMVEGETTGCGMTFHALNIDGILLQGSFNLFYSRLKGSYSALKFEAYGMLLLGQQIAPKKIKVNHGWLKTGEGTMYHGVVVPGEGKFLSLSLDSEHYMKIFSEMLLGNTTIGFNEVPGSFDKIFILTNPPTTDSIKRLSKCLDSLIKNK